MSDHADIVSSVFVLVLCFSGLCAALKIDMPWLFLALLIVTAFIAANLAYLLLK